MVCVRREYWRERIEFRVYSLANCYIKDLNICSVGRSSSSTDGPPEYVSATTYRLSKKLGLVLLHYKTHKFISGSHWYSENCTISETQTDVINLLKSKIISFSKILFLELPYFSIDNAHLLYNAHPKLFRHFF
jgi:hypothetical protein